MIIVCLNHNYYYALLLNHNTHQNDSNHPVLQLPVSVLSLFLHLTQRDAANILTANNNSLRQEFGEDNFVQVRFDF